ncbi:MAG: hypothetical protein JO235_01880 [Chroococcidiopsidaceae cyanobacterium CP_BM_RX_35]|nr:hypothetical protein [Chroococcidiopsidaceae cyanobacterium CP_BM_RX_35]
MLKCLSLATAISVTAIPLITEVTFSQSVPPEFPSLKVPNPANVDEPLCYMQTANDRTLDLQRLCGKTSPASSSLSTGISKEDGVHIRTGQGRLHT